MSAHPSVLRVMDAAAAAGVSIEIVRFETPAKTAVAAAELLGCKPAQIANSLIFEGRETGALLLLLTSGGHRVDLEHAAAQIGQGLKRADLDRVRKETGFVIGGVAPFGHLCALTSYIDEALFDFDQVWAAGGVAETVFAIAPDVLERVTGAKRFQAAILP
ncbi:MAG: YbaK/EbsC family protein [Pseudomonadota bacterium]